MGFFKCQTCGAEISAKWVSAISKNRCPGCDGEIMDNGSAELIHDLGELLEKMPNDPIGIAGWLVANYRMDRIGDCEPEEFHRPKAIGHINKNAPQQQQQNKLMEFFNNAGVDMNNIKNPPRVNKEREDVGDVDMSSLNEDEKRMLLGDGDGDDSNFSQVDIESINSLVDGSVKESSTLENYYESIRRKQEMSQMNLDSGFGAVTNSGQRAGFRRHD